MSIESPESNVEANVTDSAGIDSSSSATGTDASATALDSPDNQEVASENGEPEITDPKLMDRYECRACGYIYEPVKGDDSSGIDAGVPFAAIYDSWKCPVCTAPKRRFNNIGPAGNPSGFKENLGYGLGVNTLTPGQKNILIFGSLLLGFLFFISLYGLH